MKATQKTLLATALVAAGLFSGAAFATQPAPTGSVAGSATSISAGSVHSQSTISVPNTTSWHQATSESFNSTRVSGAWAPLDASTLAFTSGKTITFVEGGGTGSASAFGAQYGAGTIMASTNNRGENFNLPGVTASSDVWTLTGGTSSIANDGWAKLVTTGVAQNESRAIIVPAQEQQEARPAAPVQAAVADTWGKSVGVDKVTADGFGSGVNTLLLVNGVAVNVAGQAGFYNAHVSNTFSTSFTGSGSPDKPNISRPCNNGGGNGIDCAPGKSGTIGQGDLKGDGHIGK